MIRFAVIGTNWITEKFIEAALETGEGRITAVYSRTRERAEQFAAKYEIPHLYTDLEHMSASNTFDAVYIASPNSFHAAQAICCMNYGKHVLCEKPASSNANELRAMTAAAKRNGVLLMEAMKPTLMPNFEVIRSNLHKLGAIRRYFASFCQYSSRYDEYKRGTVLNAFNPSFSNGSLMDLGIYCVYPAVVLFGKPESVQACGLLLDSGVDGEGSLLLKYKQMDAVIMHSKITSSMLPNEIQGENGSMIIDKISAPGQVEIHYRDGKVEDLSVPQTANTMFYEVKEFIRLIQSGSLESPINSHARSLTAMELIDEARKQIGLVFPADAAE